MDALGSETSPGSVRPWGSVTVGRRMNRQIAEACVVVTLAALATALMTYPLVTAWTDMGRLQLTDARWSIWVVSWVAHALTTEPSTLYNANIFYPHPRALALSEANIGAGVLAAPVSLVSRNPLAVHNAAFLGSFFLAAVAAYFLARRLTEHRAAAAAAAIAFAFCPYVFSHTAHIQLLMTAGLPLTLLALHRFVDRVSTGRVVTLGVVIAAQALSCAYYGILAALLAAFGILFFAVSRGLWRAPRYWVGAAGAAIVAVGLVLPFFLPYIEAQRQSGFARNLTDARLFSADWRGYLASAAWAHRWMLPLLGRWKEPLHPGFLVAALGVAGVWLGLRSATYTGKDGTRSRDIVVFYVAVVVLAGWLSFGPDAGLYKVLYRTIPVLSFLRAPSRFGVAVTLGLAMLMAIAVDALSRRGPRWRLGLTIVPVLVAVELAVVPLKFERMPPVPRVYHALASLPRGPVAEFPFYSDRYAIQFHALYMLYSTYHWQPLVNGYSDNFPPEFFPLSAKLRSFPSAESFDALRKQQTRYLVIHFPRYAPEQRQGIANRLRDFQPRLKLLMRADGAELYELLE